MSDWLAALHARLDPHPWMWTLVVLAGLLLAAWLANWVTRHVLLRVVRRVVLASPAKWDDALMARGVLSRLAHVVPALVVLAAIGSVPGLPERAVAIVERLAQAYMAFTVALSVRNLFNAIGDLYEHDAGRRQSRPIKGYLQVAKIAVFAAAAVWVFATLAGASILHVLTGLGAMTAVVLLIFQDTILSFVASVQIASDGRIRIGDWIEMPSENADGDVVDIALYTITVQNWDKTITSIPTKKLLSESFKNWRGMTEAGGRRIKRALYIDQKSTRFLSAADEQRMRRFRLIEDYWRSKERELQAWNARFGEGADTVNNRRLTNLGTFRAYAEHYLRNHPAVRQDMTLIVRQLQPGQAGIPLEIYCFTNDTRWAAYEGIQSDIFDHLLAILPEFGLSVFQSSSDAPLTVSLVDRRPPQQAGDAAGTA
jgi:miniconductance mechanosensitive channel